MKIFTSYYCNFFDFQQDNIPLEWVSTASSTCHFDHSYTHIYRLYIEDFVVEIHHCRRHLFFRTFFVQTWFQSCTPEYTNSLAFFPVAVPLLDDEYSCNVCRDPPHGERYLINPNKSFTQSDGRVTTCGELQQWVQDVQPYGGSPGEAEICILTQYLTWLHSCDCAGPLIPSPQDNIKNPNASCDICGSPLFDFDYVPEPNRKKLTNTGCCGNHNCDGLYEAAAKGVLSSNMCQIVQRNSGKDCCNLGLVAGPHVASPSVGPTKNLTLLPTVSPTRTTSLTTSPIVSPTIRPYPVHRPTNSNSNNCKRYDWKKRCIKVFGCSWRKFKNRKGKCKIAFDTEYCSRKQKRAACINKGCVWKKSKNKCFGRWS